MNYFLSSESLRLFVPRRGPVPSVRSVLSLVLPLAVGASACVINIDGDAAMVREEKRYTVTADASLLARLTARKTEDRRRAVPARPTEPCHQPPPARR